MIESAFCGATWRKSTRSNNECVEVAVGPAAVGVRDSKNPFGPLLAVTPEAWLAFLAAARVGQFNRP